MWQIIRPDAIDVLENPLVRKILPRYVKIVKNVLPANFQIAKKIAVNEVSWEEHERAMKEFYELKQKIDNNEIDFKKLKEKEFSLLDLKIELVKEIMKSCELCERKCKVNRLKGEKGECKVGNECLISSEFVHLGEEPHIVPSHTVFFMGCNFHCQYCFPPHTLILVNKHPIAIEKLFELGKPEQMLIDCIVSRIKNYTTITHNGEEKNIIRVSKRKYSGELIVIKPYYLPELKCTPQHKLFVFDPHSSQIRKVPAEDLKEGDYLIVPKPRINETSSYFINTKKIFTSSGFVFPEYKKSVSRITKKLINKIIKMKENGHSSTEIGKTLNINPSYVRTLLSKIKRGSISSLFSKKYELVEKGNYIRFKKEKGKGIPRFIKLNPKLARLLGLYCAEGCVVKDRRRPNSYTLIFSYGRTESELINKTKKYISTIFGVKPKIVKQRTGIQIVVRNSSISLFFKLLAGGSAKEKRVPRIISEANASIIKTFLDGYIKGDGWLGSNITSMNTVSKELALGLCWLILRLGKLPRFYTFRPEPRKNIENRRVNQSMLYCVKFKSKNAWLLENKKWFFVPIRKLSREKYSGFVYNLEVKDDHSYLANFVSVSNCQNWSISQWYEKGREIEPKELAAIIEKRRLEGCRNVNLVGGSPTPHLYGIIQTLKLCKINTAVIWNSNMYMSEKTMQILDGIVDMYLSDFKYGNDKCALRLSKVPNYFSVVSRNHLLASKTAEITLRHLILPNHLECCSKPVLKWIAENLKEKCLVNIMDQYRPEWKAKEYPEINRRITNEEFENAIEYAKKLGLNLI